MIAWGVFAFGSVYPWAYIPLMAASAAVGLGGLFRPAPGARMQVALIIALAAVAVACSVQLLPVSQRTIVGLSPHTDRLLRLLDLQYMSAAQSGAAVHSLSINRKSTALALALFVSCSLLMLGTARMLTREALGRLTRGLVVIGVLLAMAGVSQKPLFGSRIYGFWTPLEGINPFGPFVNRNHFAGWMLMMLPLTAGYLLSRLARPSPDTAPDWRKRLLWYASADANQTVLVGFAVFVMAIALVLTLSRSAIVAFVGAIGLSAVLISRDSGPRERRTALAFVALVLLMPIAWVGVDVVGSRFATRDVADLDGRLNTWADAWRIVRAFPLAGTGLNTYGTVTLFYQTTDLTHYYDAAHNDYLQLAAEGGLLVAVPAVAALTFLVLTIRSRLREISSHASEYWIRVGAMTGLLAIGVQELSDFSLQNPANAVLFSVLGGIALRSVGSSRAHVR